jgi:hypothetical protein
LAECREELGRRPESQRRIGHPKNFCAPGDFDIDVCGHPGLELESRIRHIDDGRVRHDVLLDDRLQPHLRDRAVEIVGGVGVHAEGDMLPRTNAADIGLVEVGDDLHLRQVSRENEQSRRLHAGGDRLPDVDVA